MKKSMELWGLVALRLVVGFGFAAHGYAKLGRGPAAFAAILATLGVPSPLPAAWATTLLELGGGVLIMAGAFVRGLSLPLGAILAVAALGVHARYGFSSVRLRALTAAGAEFGPVGYEIDLLYLAALAALALSQASPLSFGGWLARRKGSRT
ncbi:MAG TPA: DoxX family protein [Myxococcales bacterium]|nr:DoxX family protein [Myxococcales bacterium]